MLWFYDWNQKDEVFGGFNTLDELNDEMSRHQVGQKVRTFTIIDAETREEAEQEAMATPNA